MLRPALFFLMDLFRQRYLIIQLAKRDYQQQYAGSYLGFAWVYIQPLLYVSILFYVFTLGFKASGAVGAPFDVYLIAGMIPWLYFSSNFVRNTNVLSAHAFMIKKVNFRLSVLPLVQLASSTVPHVFLLLVVISVSWYKGYSPTFYTVQVLYYFLCMVLLLTGLAWITASTSLFITDVKKLVSIVAQFGFWLTPIFWSVDMLPDEWRWIVTFNPVGYIVMGYRDAIIYGQPFWEKPLETVFFWLFAVSILVTGVAVFRRLKPHFAEVV